MYARQRADALADWTMQSEYNSPAAQMQRLKVAGLNPNLVYGNGADAQMSAPVRSSNIPSWNPKAPEVNPMVGQNALAAYQQTQVTQAQIDNLKRQNTVLTQEAMLKAAQVITETTRGARGQFDLSYLSDVRNLSIEKLMADITNLQAESRGKTADWQLKEGTLQANIESAFAGLTGIRLRNAKTVDERNEILERINLMKKQGVLKDWEIRLSRQNLSPRDKLWSRKLAEWFDDLF